MGFDDIIDSAPSVAGFAATTFACLAVPAAIPLAAMQGSIISDPAQIRHAGDRHGALTGKAEAAGTELDQAVEKRSGDWEAKDKQAFVSNHVDPYKHALTKTSELHKGVKAAMDTLAKAFQDLGLLSMGIGTVLATCASGVLGVALVPGANVAAESAATATAETSTTVFRGILSKLGSLLLKAAKLLLSVKGLLAGTAFGGVALYTSLSTKKGELAQATAPGMGNQWPGVAAKPELKIP